MILARVELDYRSPVGYGESLEVGVRCASVRRSSLTVDSAIAAGDGRVVAESRKVLVHYDYSARRSRPLPEELRQRLLAQDPDLAIEV